MIHPYNEVFFDKVKFSIGSIFYIGVVVKGYQLDEVITKFVKSNVAKQIDLNNMSYIISKSSYELFNKIFENSVNDIEIDTHNDMFIIGELFAGFNYETGVRFDNISKLLSAFELRSIYIRSKGLPYEVILELLIDSYKRKLGDSNLKRIRVQNGLTQKDLAILSKVPIRTIQQYEQKQKNINKASADSLLTIAKVLYCRVEDLLEI